MIAKWTLFPVTGMIVILLGTLSALPGARAEETLQRPEVWFQCEFAHSRIPPDDNCRMLDDDGFMVLQDIIYHVKVSDSRETGCRGQRTGHCFLQTRKEIVVNGNEIGPITRTKNGFSVAFLGCTQTYKMTALEHFVKVTPDEDQCFWTPDKQYYVVRYKGRLISADD